MIKSPLRYPGGKSRAVKLISSLVPDFSEYREPFVGGGSVFIYLKQLFPNMTFWINDLYLELCNFWQMVQQDVDEIIRQIDVWRKEYPYIRELFSYATVISWDLTYGMRNIKTNSDQIGKELFISNYLTQLPEKQQFMLFSPMVGIQN